jgi:hypothetical protein
MTIVTSNEVNSAAPELIDHIAGIHCQVDSERTLIGRTIEVRDLSQWPDLLQARYLIKLCEIPKISDFLHVRRRHRLNSARCQD